MSVATISYRSLKDASSEANSVAQKLSRYADSLNNCVYRKLNNYSGSYTGNIQTAKNNANVKINNLYRKSEAYTRYANDLNDLKDKCYNTDKAVRTLVSDLAVEFKRNHGIRNSKLQNYLNYHLTGLKNSSSAGRWLGDGADKLNSIMDYGNQKLEDWWDYEGGKQLIKGLASAGFAIAIAVCSIIATVATGGAFLVVVAGVIGSAIAIGNACVDMANEVRAYNETHNNGDPALGRRRSDENTLQDTIRRESDSQGWHNIALGIDIVNFACDVIGIADGIMSFGKNGFKFLKEKKIFTKDFFKNIGSNMSNGVNNIKAAWKMKKFDMFNDFTSRLKSNFIFNLKDKFDNFSSLSKGAETVKRYLEIGKEVIDKGYGVRNLGDILLKKIVLPCTTLFTVKGSEANSIEHITLGDAYDIYEGYTELFEYGCFKDKVIGNAVFNKLKHISKINISLPEIHAFDFKISKVAA